MTLPTTVLNMKDLKKNDAAIVHDSRVHTKQKNKTKQKLNFSWGQGDLKCYF